MDSEWPQKPALRVSAIRSEEARVHEHQHHHLTRRLVGSRIVFMEIAANSNAFDKKMPGQTRVEGSLSASPQARKNHRAISKCEKYEKQDEKRRNAERD